MLLPDFDHEMAVTRTLMERAPESRLQWTPHPRSWTLAELCVHLAHLPLWGVMVIRQSAFDLHPVDGTPLPRPRFESHAATLRTFDEHVAQARHDISGAADRCCWPGGPCRMPDARSFTMPRLSVIRSFVLSHMIHHRGQLSVYLRLCEVPLPAIYGPTADSATSDA